MATHQPSSGSAALVLDSNVLIAISSQEAGRDAIATAELTRFTNLGYEWYAPGIIVGEALYVLCGKVTSGDLSPSAYATAMVTFQTLMESVLPPPDGDRSLIKRAEQIRSGYGCSRSADAVYLALAEELGQTMPTVLLTFDQGLPNQALRNAPGVVIQVL